MYAQLWILEELLERVLSPLNAVAVVVTDAPPARGDGDNCTVRLVQRAWRASSRLVARAVWWSPTRGTCCWRPRRRPPPARASRRRRLACDQKKTTKASCTQWCKAELKDRQCGWCKCQVCPHCQPAAAAVPATQSVPNASPALHDDVRGKAASSSLLIEEIAPPTYRFGNGGWQFFKLREAWRLMETYERQRTAYHGVVIKLRADAILYPWGDGSLLCAQAARAGARLVVHALTDHVVWGRREAMRVVAHFLEDYGAWFLGGA